MGGVVVTVSLLAVSMAAVFGADQVRLLKGRAENTRQSNKTSRHQPQPVLQLKNTEA